VERPARAVTVYRFDVAPDPERPGVYRAEVECSSGTYIRGRHIYNPLTGGLPDPEVVSITVVGPDVYDADGYATAAFAMGRNGIGFIEALDGFEGYMIDSSGVATFTSGFDRYVEYRPDHENNR